jgi:hypothetical protein
LIRYSLHFRKPKSRASAVFSRALRFRIARSAASVYAALFLFSPPAWAQAARPQKPNGGAIEKRQNQGAPNAAELELRRRMEAADSKRAHGAGSAAGIVPLNPKSEAQAAPLLPADTDPFARVDASVVARANLTEEQRAAADLQEDRLRAALGLSFNDLATSEAVRELEIYKELKAKQRDRDRAAIPAAQHP